MLFTSFTFWGLLLATILIATLARRGRPLRLVLLAASLLFYAGGDGANIAILIISASADFIAGYWVRPDRSPRIRKLALFSAIGINLGILGYFKYLRFFLTDVFLVVDPSWHADLILPLGISFYTFQSMSYTIDVYRGKAETCRNYFDFFLYVSFFPQLVAGPIERARHLLPEIMNARLCSWSELKAPIVLVSMAFFKKLFVADSIGATALLTFNDHAARPLETYLAGWVMAIQVYFDFSAYSDFALGLALLFGVKLSPNFRPVWFATNPLAFWERWNITTGRWFRDYFLIPLGRNGDSRFAAARNMILMFTAIGLWHGASWNWVLWGVMHGIIVAVYRDMKKHSSLVERAPAWIGFFFIQLLLLPISGLLHHAGTPESKTRILSSVFDSSYSWSDISGVLTLAPHLAFYLTPAILLDLLAEKTDLKKIDTRLLFVFVAIMLGFAFFMAKGIRSQSFIYFAF